MSKQFLTEYLDSLMEQANGVKRVMKQSSPTTTQKKKQSIPTLSKSSSRSNAAAKKDRQLNNGGKSLLCMCLPISSLDDTAGD